MALIPKTVGDLRKYLETWEDDKRIFLDMNNTLFTFSVIPMFHGNDETVLVMEPWKKVEMGENAKQP